VTTALAAKLRMAAAALGCESRKALCARFRGVNPATQCELERLNKWMQGRSLPRTVSVYADLAAVIGSTKSGAWIAECALDDFAAELTACTGAQATVLNPAEAPVPHATGPRVGGPFGVTATLAGAFASYSLAWSPHFRGSIIRGSLRLWPNERGKLLARYAENLLGRRLILDGEVQIRQRSMDVTLREPESRVPLFVTLHVPGPPASVLCGVMSGTALIAHEALPSAVRIVFIRVPDTSTLDATNRYFTPMPGAVVGDLATLGLRVRAAEDLDAFTREFLGDVPAQVTGQDQATLAGMLDREYFAPAGPQAVSRAGNLARETGEIEAPRRQG